MKKKSKLIILTLVCSFLLTGCTSYLKDDQKKVVRNEKTGQNIVDNILCQPTYKSTLNIYEEHEMLDEVKKFTKCKEFKINSGGYDGLWTSFFVKPLAWLIVSIANLVKNSGIAIIIVTLIIRSVMIPFTKQAALQSENLKKVKPELDKLEKKYKNKTDQDSQMKKSQEMLMLYKQYNINPLSGCLFSFIQLPLFFAFYEALYRLPLVFEGKLGPISLGTSPLIAVGNGNYFPVLLAVTVFIVTYYSFKLNSGAAMSAEQESQMKTMRNVSLVLIGTTSFTISSAISLYWITNSSFTIVQNLLVKRGVENDKSK